MLSDKLQWLRLPRCLSTFLLWQWCEWTEPSKKKRVIDLATRRTLRRWCFFFLFCSRFSMLRFVAKDGVFGNNFIPIGCGRATKLCHNSLSEHTHRGTEATGTTQMTSMWAVQLGPRPAKTIPHPTHSVL